MATLRRAGIGEILLAIQARLVAATGFHTTRVIIAAVANPGDVPHQGAEQDILIMPRDESPEVAVDGGGRYVNLRKRTIEVAARTRLRLDTAQGDEIRLTDTSLGHLALEDLIADALENWFPLDGTTGDALCTDLDVGRCSRPTKDPKDPTWVSSGFTMTFQYLRNLTLPEVVVTP